MRKLLLGLALSLFSLSAWAQQVTTPPIVALACAYNSGTQTGTSGQFMYVQCDVNGKIITSGGAPGGSNTQIQYNNAGAFGGISGWTTNGTDTITGTSIVFSNPALSNTTGIIHITTDTSQPQVGYMDIEMNDAGFRMGGNLRYLPNPDCWYIVNNTQFAMMHEFGQGGWARNVVKPGTSPASCLTNGNGGLRMVEQIGWSSGDPFFQIYTALEVFARTTAPGFNWIQKWKSEDTLTTYATMGTTGSFQLTPAANVSPLTVAGYSLTGSNAQSMFDLAGTLNTSGSPDVFKIAITDTARGASTKLFNIYAGASGTTSEFSIDRAGNVIQAGNTAMVSGTVLAWNSDAGVSRAGAAVIDIGNGTAGDITGQINALGYRSGANGFALYAASAATGNAIANLITSATVPLLDFGNTGVVGWNSAADLGSGSFSVGFAFASAGVAKVTTSYTTPNASGSLLLTNLTGSGANIIFSALGNAATTSAVCYNTGTGLLTYNSTVGTCTVSSISAKEIIAPLSPAEGFKLVMAMEPTRYQLRKDHPAYIPGEQIGFVAEKAEKFDKRVVAYNADGTAGGFRYEQYTAALTAAFKYLKADNDNIRAELAAMKKATR